MDRLRKIDKAATKFKFVSNSKNKKFKFLPEWTLAEANYFYSEIQSKRGSHKVYDRGALVFVDFGINIGNELSGNHFAIVLNKSDSPKNGVLTVIPVSSKTNKFSVELDGLISNKSFEFLGKHLEKITNLISQDSTKNQEAENEARLLNKVMESYARFNKISYAKCLDIRTISKHRIIKINKYDPVGKIKISNETLDKIDKVIIENFINFRP